MRQLVVVEIEIVQRMETVKHLHGDGLQGVVAQVTARRNNVNNNKPIVDIFE